MSIRRVKKKRKNSDNVFYQYNLVQAARTGGSAKQRVILYLGSDNEMRDKSNRDTVLQILKAKIFGQPELFPSEPPTRPKALALSY